MWQLSIVLLNLPPPEFNIYIHIDKCAKIKLEDINPRANVYSVYKIHWGAVEHLDAIWLLLMEACTSGDAYDYYHIISGQDFYACPPSDFDKLLGDNKTNYIGVFSIPNKHWAWHQGYDIFRYRTLASYGDVRKFPLRAVNKVWYHLQKCTHIYRSLPDFPLYGSAVWCSLHGDFVRWLLKSEIAAYLLKRLRNSTCAEEVFFATCIMNSPYCDYISKDNPLRYWDWHVKIPPKVLDVSDFPSIKSAHALFCRKVDTARSAKLLPLLKEYISK